MADEIKYVPYNDDDLLLGEMVVYKKYRTHKNDRRLIIGQGIGYVVLCDGTVSYQRLFETYEHIDGTPAGKVTGNRDQGLGIRDEGLGNRDEVSMSEKHMMEMVESRSGQCSVVSGQLSVTSGQCEHKDRVIEDHESCIRGKIIRLVCVDCGKVLDTEIIR